jgi:hypothetical protein
MTAGSSADPAKETMALVWQRSTFCTASGCVEVASAEGTVYVRDSESVNDGRMIAAPLSAWQAFLSSVRSGEFDL